jgi:hypothetical protein
LNSRTSRLRRPSKPVAGHSSSTFHWVWLAVTAGEGREPGPLEGVTTTERRVPVLDRGGIGPQGIIRRSTGLPPGYGTARLNRRVAGPPGGPRRTRTVSSSLQGGAPPLVRWAHESAGRSRTWRADAPGLRPGTVRPATAMRGWDRSGPRCGARTAIDHLLAISSVVKVLFGRDEPTLLRKSVSRIRRGAGSRTTPSAEMEAARLPALGRAFFAGLVQKAKEPLPRGSGSRTVTDL